MAAIRDVLSDALTLPTDDHDRSDKNVAKKKMFYTLQTNYCKIFKIYT